MELHVDGRLFHLDVKANHKGSHLVLDVPSRPHSAPHPSTHF